MNITLGEIVRSKAGRDSGRHFIITEVIDEFYVLLTDGDLRKIEKPKKKKIRHLDFTGVVAPEIADMLKKGTKINNSGIRKALEGFREK